MKNQIKICMGSSCFARGNSENLEIIEKYIKENALSANIELVGSRCEDKCDKGPNISINGKNFQNVNNENVIELLKGELL